MAYLIIDFEASAIGRRSFPVEVAWVDPVSGSGASSLIAPIDRWLGPGCWDPACEKVHGISPEMLDESGRPVAEVSSALLTASAGLRLLSDMPPVDLPLLQMLMGISAPPLTDFWQALDLLGASRSAIAQAVEDVDQALPAGHRAKSHAARLAFIYRRAVSGLPHRPA